MIKIKDYYEKIMNTKRLVIILIIGIALLFLPDLSFSEEKAETTSDTNHIADINKYGKNLEKKLSAMLSTTNGAEDVSVMIAFADFGKFVYCQETQEEKSETSLKGNQKPVLMDSASGGEEPLLVKAELPEITGVLITAKGAENPVVKENITSAVKAVLNVSTKNISVLAK